MQTQTKEKKETQKRVKWTEASVRDLLTKNRRYYVLDTEVVGLRIYVDVTGHKTFHLQRYVSDKGYNIRSKLGTFPEMSLNSARKLAKKYKSLSLLGKDPKLVQQKQESETKLFGTIVREFIDKRLVNNDKNTRTRKQFMRGWFLFESRDIDFSKFLKTNKKTLNIQSKTISEIDEDYLVDYFNCAKQRGIYGCNRLMGTIRMLINWEIKREKYLGKNPVKIVKKDNFLWSYEEKDHLDFYDKEDMSKIIKSARKLAKVKNYRVACYGILAALFCGGRPHSEVFNLTWDQIIWKRKLVHYVKTKTGGGDRPITDTMIAHLEEIKKERENKGTASPFYYPPSDARHNYIFPNWMFGKNKMTLNGVKKCKLKHIHEVKLMWKKIKEDAGVKSRDLKSLRHTFATYCVLIGVPLRMIQKYLMHKSIKTTEVYAAASEDLVVQENEKLSAGFKLLDKNVA